ncbi:GNAT family N-acetyltransferase [Hallella sp.]|uniref:GNAT family N-acetyltransferase n=1 Tax=Hallella sp. TaxID=2980186 RepID=UPI00307BBBEF
MPLDFSTRATTESCLIDEAIGCIGYYTHETSNIPIGENDCEVGYWVGKTYWNRGICTEALKQMLDYCINEKHFENIWADHFTGILHRESHGEMRFH